MAKELEDENKSEPNCKDAYLQTEHELTCLHSARPKTGPLPSGGQFRPQNAEEIVFARQLLLGSTSKNAICFSSGKQVYYTGDYDNPLTSRFVNQQLSDSYLG